MKASTLFDDPKVRHAVAEKELEAAEHINRLTKTQIKVLALITDGILNKNVAHALGISQRTIENHRKAIMERTGCKTFAELVRLTVLAGV